jgi:hypothetical protein
MSEQQVEVPDVKQDTATTASEEKQPVNQVPYARFSGLVDEKNALKIKLDAFEKGAAEQAESRKLKKMEEKGEFDQVLAAMTSKLEAAEKKANAFDELNATERESLLSELPEEDRATYEGLSLINLRVHVKKVSTTPSPASVDNSKPTSTGGYASFEEWASLDPSGYKKANNPQTSGNIKIGYGN